jgi:hypothetical protein
VLDTGEKVRAELLDLASQLDFLGPVEKRWSIKRSSGCARWALAQKMFALAESYSSESAEY